MPSPYEIIVDTFDKWLHTCSLYIDVDVTQQNFKISRRLWLSLLGVGIFLLSNIYTVMVCELSIALQAIILACIALHAFVTFGCFWWYRENLVQAKTTLIHAYSVNKDHSNSALAFFANLSLFAVKLTVALYGVSSVLFTLIPAMKYLLTGKLTLLLPSRLPGIDITQPLDYIALGCFHLWIIGSCPFAYGYYSGLYAVLALNLSMFAELISNQVTQLNALLTDKKQSKRTGAIRLHYRNILLMHKEFNAYLMNIEQCFVWVNYSQIFVLSAAIVLLIFDIIFLSEYESVSLLLCMVFQVFSICAIGTLADIAVRQHILTHSQ